MRKFYVMMLSLMMSIGAMAGEKDEYFTLNAGFLFNNTLNGSYITGQVLQVNGGMYS